MAYAMTQTMKKKYLLFIMCGMALFSCQERKAKPQAVEEDLKAKQLLQGIWVNEDIQDVAFRVKGDTVYYPDSTIQPVYFQIIKDTFVLHGSVEARYPIIRQTAHLFVFRNQAGEEVSLMLSSDSEDAALFAANRLKSVNQNKLIKRDTVVAFGGERYHCYVQVNPTSYKVVKSTYNDDDVRVDHFYYDNIVNLHIFHGLRKLFSSDFHKKDFAAKVPADFLGQAVLSDLIFKRIDDRGVHYIAQLAIPDSMSSFEVEVVVSFSGRISMEVD